jgi:hypothetical protein
MITHFVRTKDSSLSSLLFLKTFHQQKLTTISQHFWQPSSVKQFLRLVFIQEVLLAEELLYTSHDVLTGAVILRLQGSIASVVGRRCAI